MNPLFLYQYEEKTNEISLDLNFKVYKIIDDGRIWMGISRRQNNVKIRMARGLIPIKITSIGPLLLD